MPCAFRSAFRSSTDSSQICEPALMTLARRIIPCLDTDGARVVKGVNFVDRRVAAELAIPLTAGGGIRCLDDARSVIRAGADKITVNTAAVERPELITELSGEFGAQAVVVAIDAKRDGSHWKVRVRGG